MDDDGLLFGSGCLTIKDHLVADIKQLVLSFHLRESDAAFADFQAHWKELNFSLIHYACLDPRQRQIFTEFLFTACQNFFILASSVKFKASIVYALFLLYKTQPERAQIPISVNGCNELMQAIEDCTQLRDVLDCFSQLLREDAFAVVGGDQKCVILKKDSEEARAIEVDAGTAQTIQDCERWLAKK